MRIIDLSVSIYTGMPIYPGDPDVQADVVHTHQTHTWELRKLVMGTHTGTHVDAFSHMHIGKETLDEIPLERFFGKAQVVDPQGDWPSETGLFFAQEAGDDLADKIIGRKPGFVGGALTEELQRILLGHGIVTYTDLINMELLPFGKDFMFYGLPLKIKDGDGSPVRAIAIVDE
ncbi:cyclase family protein [Paenibacillus mesophilus]|uniref:cyclase family protein n=1 Tax=Paenibacillus mesophilus TaxID=2582849 RepID=UPI00110E3A87|nr:cyclase family protein [Paenibacillus mesophilus]TMV50144.1 cyclase family protein [Paenibacillus mesophilus]